MDRKTFALYTLIVGAFVGVIGELLFYGKQIGLSFPLFIAIAIAVVLASSSLMRDKLCLRNLWLLIPACFFAGMVAVRADPIITALNVIVTLALSALALNYLPSSRPLDLESTADHLFSIFDASFGAVIAPLYEVFDSLSWLFERLEGNWRTLFSVGRGLVIATPIVLIFVVLLGSADAVFAGYVTRLLHLITFPQWNDSVYQVGFAGVIGWMACGTVAYGAARRERLQHIARTDKPKRKLPTLGLIEGCMVLGSVDLLFGLFVIVQFAYFFGGRATLSLSNLTYSEYARRGFFELVAVSVLTLGLVLLLDAVTLRRMQRHTRVFQALVVILVALTGVILVSASQRMWLYEEQFGFTLLRVYTHVFMGWLAVLFVFFLLALFRLRPRIFSLGVLIVLIGYLGTLNLMNVEGYIAERNVARAADGYEVDFDYLSQLSVDAVPTMLRFYETAALPGLKQSAGQWLTWKLVDLDVARQNDGSSIFSANFARDSAWAALDPLRASLPHYDPSYFLRSTPDVSLDEP